MHLCVIWKLEAGWNHYFCYCTGDGWVGCGRRGFMWRSRCFCTSGWGWGRATLTQASSGSSLTSISMALQWFYKHLILCVKDVSARMVMAGLLVIAQNWKNPQIWRGEWIHKFGASLQWHRIRDFLKKSSCKIILLCQEAKLCSELQIVWFKFWKF